MGKLGVLSLESLVQAWMSEVKELPLRLDREPTRKMMWRKKANKVLAGWKLSETGCQVRTGHQVPIVCVRGDGLRPKEENQFVQEEKGRVATLVLTLE